MKKMCVLAFQRQNEWLVSKSQGDRGADGKLGPDLLITTPLFDIYAGWSLQMESLPLKHTE